METIRDTLKLNIHPIEELLPSGDDPDLGVLCPAAVGAALETDRR